MKYKYENIESVEVKEVFKAHKHDDDYEITKTIEIPVGTKGVIVSMGCSSLDGFIPHYDIELKIGDKEFDIAISEKEMDKLFQFNQWTSRRHFALGVERNVNNAEKILDGIILLLIAFIILMLIQNNWTSRRW